MVLDYEFFVPPRIVFGWGRRRGIGALAAALGRRAFVVSGSKTLEKNGTLGEVLEQLRAGRVEAVHVASISHEPEVAHVDRLVASILEQQARSGDLIVGIGGGSAI